MTPARPAPTPSTLGLERYVAQVLADLVPLTPRRLPLPAAHGTVLAEDLTARLPVPPWTNSAMDGYAVRAADVAGASPTTPVTLPVSGDVPAGVPATPLAPGTTQRIMTGAILPEGADAVVPVENTDQEPGPAPLPAAVGIRAATAPGRHVRQAAEDVPAGATVLAAGTLLGATALASAASTGHGEVLAHPRVRVAVLATGAELVDPGTGLSPGAVPDSNSVLAAGLAVEHGAEVTWVGRVGDDPADLPAVLRAAASAADLVVTMGGVSAGAFDPLKALEGAVPASGPAGPTGRCEGAAARAIHLTFVKVAMQPGKPQGHGWVVADDGRTVPLIALPGNPVSVLVSFTAIVAPALAVLAGRPLPGPAGHVRAASAWASPAGRRQHVPVRLVAGRASGPADDAAPVDAVGPETVAGRAGRGRDLPWAAPDTTDGAAGDLPWAAPTHRLRSGSHLVGSLHLAEGLAVVPEDATAVEVGDVLPLLTLGAGRASSASLLPTARTAEEHQ